MMNDSNPSNKTPAPGGSGGARSFQMPQLVVLHIDDDPNDTALLQAATRRAGVSFHLHNAHDAEEAMSYLSGQGQFADRQAHPLPALVLLDLKMPRATGFEILRWIRSRMQFTNLPVIVFSGSELQDDIRRAYDTGANSYLVGVQLSWDIFKGNQIKNTITIQKLERDKLSEQLAQQKDQSQLELNKAYHDLSDARFEIQQEKAAIEQASESLRILQNRYQQGLVNTTDVLTAETQLSQQKFALAQASFTMNLTRYYLQFLTATTNK